MKNILHILCLSFLALLFGVSCNRVEPGSIATMGALSITVTDDNDPQKQEVVNTVRLIVFDDMSGSPKVEVNQYVEMSDPQQATEIISSRMEVSAGKDKMVVAIVNEPRGQYNLKSLLDRVQTPSDLENITYSIAWILNADGGIIPASGMPMAGVIRDIEVRGNNTTSVKMVVERAVARVDVYLEATSGGPETGYAAGSTSVTMHNITYDSYFVVGNVANGTRDNVDARKNFGKVFTSTDPLDRKDVTWIASQTKTWTYSTSPGSHNRRLMGSFYTAERIFAANHSDRILISMENVKKGSGVTGMSMMQIPFMTGTGGQEIFNEIRRNNVYEITAKVSGLANLEITGAVKPWSVINVDIGGIN